LGPWPNIVPSEHRRLAPVLFRPDLVTTPGRRLMVVQIGAERCKMAAWRKHKRPFDKAFQYRQVLLGGYARWPRAAKQARTVCS